MVFENYMHDLFVKYCNKHNMGNAWLELNGELGIVTRSGIKKFDNRVDLLNELTK